MEGRVIVITGASSGIGESAALQLAGMGAHVLLVAHDFPAQGSASPIVLAGSSGCIGIDVSCG